VRLAKECAEQPVSGKCDPNDPANVFAWLARAWRNRDAGISLLLYDPFISKYKDDPRFAAFCRKVGLPVTGEATARKST